MSLKGTVLGLREQLKTATAAWREELLAAEPLKVGDVVRVTTPVVKHNFNANLESVSSVVHPDKVVFGKVHAVKIVADRVSVEFVGQLKNGKFGVRELHIPYGSKVEKVTE